MNVLGGVNVRLVLDASKTLEENAALYFEKSKKAKRKLQGTLKALKEIEEKVKNLQKEIEQQINNKKLLKESVLKQPKRKEWFEKFRWCFLPSKILMVAGRDATSNEVLIKRYTDKDDIVLHSEIGGSPFVVVKSKDLSKKELKLAADFAVTFSKAWKSGFYSYDVAVVKASQVSKKAKSGEYLTKGGFMIYGPTKTVVGELNLTIGLYDIDLYEKKAMSGPLEAVKTFCKEYVIVKPGNNKASDTAKIIARKLGLGVDEVLRALPSGGFDFI